MLQSETTLQKTSKLAHIYPCIEEELCNRHTENICAVKNAFKRVWANSAMQDSVGEVQNYVIVNGNLELFEGKEGKEGVWMGIENGVVVAVGRGCKESKLRIKGTMLQQELVLTPNAKYQQHEHPPTAEQAIIVASLSQSIADVSLSKQKGGHLYFHSNLPVSFQREKALSMAIFIAGLVINEIEDEYSYDEMVEKLLEIKEVHMEKEEIERWMGFEAGWYLMAGSTGVAQYQFSPKSKLIFYELQNKNQNTITANVSSKDYSLSPALLQQILSSQKTQLSVQLLAEISNLSTQFNLKHFMIVNQQYLMILVESSRACAVLSKLSKVINNRSSNPDNDGLEQRRKMNGKIKEKIFTGSPSRGVAILRPQFEMWYD